ncbi:type II secretion system F family protein [Propionibacteriaceae bacterium Y2011]
MSWSDQLMLLVALAGVVLTVVWTVPAPPRRPAGHRPADVVGRVGAGRFAWLLGRPDAMPVRRRTGLAAGMVAATALLVQALGVPAWLGWSVGVVAGGAGWVVLGRLLPDHVRRRRRRVRADLPEVCDLLAACLGAGLPLSRAVAVVADVVGGPVAEDLGRVRALVAVGEPEPLAWRHLAGDPAWSRLATDLARAVDSGTALEDTMAHHARRTRVALRAARELRSRTAGVRSVLPLMVCFLPAFFLIGVVPIIAGLVLRLLG